MSDADRFAKMDMQHDLCDESPCWECKQELNSEGLECSMVYDGVDTDGTIWYLCNTHDELAPSDVAPCAGYKEESYRGNSIEEVTGNTRCDSCGVYECEYHSNERSDK